ncbi:MAG: SlyX family protein [Puniceicoccales bacterium]|jgi:uncharacterized coiled-coil protein SlyX|nr:SlyX family protein [Puniceicoccales bacterium]
MDDAGNLVARVRELEIKISFLENHVEAQDREMLEQSRQFDLLKAEVKRLRELSSDQGSEGFPANEKPPHY